VVKKNEQIDAFYEPIWNFAGQFESSN